MYHCPINVKRGNLPLHISHNLKFRFEIPVGAINYTGHCLEEKYVGALGPQEKYVRDGGQ